jgi:hypothetical protein
VISKTKISFGYKSGDLTGDDISPADPGVTLYGINWMSASQLLLTGLTADGGSYQSTYELNAENR